MGNQNPASTEAGRSSNQGPLGEAGVPQSGTVVLSYVDRRHSPPNHFSRKPGVERQYRVPFSREDGTPKTWIQGIGGYPKAWCHFAVARRRRTAPERRASSEEQAKPHSRSETARKPVCRSNGTRKSAVSNGKLPSSTGQCKRAKTPTLQAYDGVLKPHSIEQCGPWPLGSPQLRGTV